MLLQASAARYAAVPAGTAIFQKNKSFANKSPLPFSWHQYTNFSQIVQEIPEKYKKRHAAFSFPHSVFIAFLFILFKSLLPLQSASASLRSAYRKGQLAQYRGFSDVSALPKGYPKLCSSMPESPLTWGNQTPTNHPLRCEQAVPED